MTESDPIFHAANENHGTMKLIQGSKGRYDTSIRRYETSIRRYDTDDTDATDETGAKGNEALLDQRRFVPRQEKDIRH